MAGTVTITSPEFRHIEQVFLALGRMGEDLTPLMRQAASILQGATEDAFQHERSPDGAQWQDLAKATAMAFVTKGRKGKNGKRTGRKVRGQHPILQVTGRLAASVVTFVTPKQASIGSNLIYARIHQQGGMAGRGRAVSIPRRAFIGVGVSHAQEIEGAAVQLIAAIAATRPSSGAA